MFFFLPGKLTKMVGYFPFWSPKISNLFFRFLPRETHPPFRWRGQSLHSVHSFFWDGQEGTKTVRNLLYFRFFYGLVISVADETPAEPFKRYYCWKILQKCWLVGDMLVAWRVYYPVICRDYFINHYKDPYQLAKFPTNCIRIRRYFLFPIIYWIS